MPSASLCLTGVGVCWCDAVLLSWELQIAEQWKEAEEMEEERQRQRSRKFIRTVLSAAVTAAPDRAQYCMYHFPVLVSLAPSISAALVRALHFVQ